MHGVPYIDAGHLYMYMPLTPRLSKALGSLHNGARCLAECTCNQHPLAYAWMKKLCV